MLRAEYRNRRFKESAVSAAVGLLAGGVAMTLGHPEIAYAYGGAIVASELLNMVGNKVLYLAKYRNNEQVDYWKRVSTEGVGGMVAMASGIALGILSPVSLFNPITVVGMYQFAKNLSLAAGQGYRDVVGSY